MNLIVSCCTGMNAPNLAQIRFQVWCSDILTLYFISVLFSMLELQFRPKQLSQIWKATFYKTLFAIFFANSSLGGRSLIHA